MLIPILVFAVLAIFLIFCLVKSAETWTWLQITLVALIFLTGIFGGLMATRSMKTRQAWMKQYLENEEDIEELEAGFSSDVFGEPDTIDYGVGSLRELSFRQELMQLGQGRIWYDGGISLDNNAYRLSFVVPENGVSALNQLKVDMVLFAFGDRSFEVNGELTPLPADFMGSFRVASVDQGNANVILAPLFEAKQLRVGSQMRKLATALAGGDTKQMAAAAELAIELQGDERTDFDTAWQGVANGGAADSLVTWLNDKASSRQPQGNWALFEKMPGDEHDVFRTHLGMDVRGIWEEATPETLAEYRQALQDNYLPAEMVHLDPASEAYEDLLDEFTFDGVPMNVVKQYVDRNVASRHNDSFEPSDDNLWGYIEFNKKSEGFRVNGEGNQLTDGDFDFNGGAISKALKNSEEQVTFSAGDRLLVPKLWGVKGFKFGNNDTQPPITETSDEATWLGIEFYVRPVRDYPFRLSRYLDLARRAIEQERIVSTDIGVTLQMQNDTQLQQSNRSDILAKLASDIERMKLDLEAITTLRQQREAELSLKQEKIRTYYNQIIELYKLSQVSGDGEFLDTRVRRPRQRSLAKQSR